MKTILLSLLTISALSADVVQSTEIELEGWYADESGTFQNNGNAINLAERGLDKALAPSIGIDFNEEGFYKNFKLNYTHIDQDAKKALTADMQHNGVNFDANEMTKSTVKLDMIDAVYYVDAAKNDLAEVDLGLGLRYVNGSYQTKVCSKETTTNFHKWSPIGYINLKVTPSWLPAVWTSQLLLSPDSSEIFDIRSSLKKEVANDIAIEAGYRANKYNLTDGYQADILSQGMFMGLSYTF